MITISALIGKGIVDSSLKYHLLEGKKNGITKEEISEMITHVAFYCGWPNAWDAFNMAKEVYQDDISKDGGQILIVVAGHGWYQEEGCEPVSDSEYNKLEK